MGGEAKKDLEFLFLETSNNIANAFIVSHCARGSVNIN